MSSCQVDCRRKEFRRVPERLRKYTVSMVRNASTSGHGAHALAGACIVITRPVGTSGNLRRRVLALGGRAVTVPGLALRRPLDPVAASRALSAARRDDDWIFTSPSAVRFAFDLLPGLRIAKRARVLAVGRATANALARHHIEAQVPDVRQDAAGLLALSELQSVRDRNIALVTAPGGRDLIQPALARRGASVRVMHVYRRVPPRLTQRHFSALSLAASPQFVLVSSGEALANLIRLLPENALRRLRRETLVVSSARLATLAKRHDFRSIITARSALADDLLAATGAALAHHRL